MKTFITWASRLAVALCVVYILTPFTPTGLLIQLRSVTIGNDHIILDRDVTIPIDAAYTVEVHWDGVLLRDCNDNGVTLFERRTRPAVVPLNCDISRPGLYQIKICVHAIGAFGLQYRASCVDYTWLVANTDAERVLQEQIDGLQGSVRSLWRGLTGGDFDQ